jgi:hypothetical protein
METTLPSYDCSIKGHIGKVVKDGYDLIDGQMFPKVELFGCTKCDATSPEPWSDWGVVTPNSDHIDSEFCPCFGCKAKTLQLSPGDAASNKNMSQKKWDKELNLYRDARKQGIQPAGTSTKQVQKAIDDSNKVGKAYDANTNSFKG